MKTSKKIITFVIALVMLNNVEHLGHVHYTLSVKLLPELIGDWLNKLHSVVVVIIFEVVVITFAREGKKGYSLFFTFCIWILNMIYYKAPELLINGDYEQLTAATVYSTIFTISIYMFSEMLAEYYQEQNVVKILESKLVELRSELKQSQSELKDCHAELVEAQTVQANLSECRAELVEAQNALKQYQEAESKAKKDLTCPYCKSYQAESQGSLTAHKGHCPDNPKNQKS